MTPEQTALTDRLIEAADALKDVLFDLGRSARPDRTNDEIRNTFYAITSIDIATDYAKQMIGEIQAKD